MHLAHPFGKHLGLRAAALRSLGPEAGKLAEACRRYRQFVQWVCISRHIDSLTLPKY